MTEQPTQVRVTVATALDEETTERYYRLYRETFQHLEVQAVARQVLHRDEFFEEMADPRVHKYLAWEGERTIGLTTLTKDLETVPWISPQYFAHHYPQYAARDAIYYLGFTLVERARQRSHVFASMIEACTEQVLADRGMCAWDICRYNDEVLGLGEGIARMMGRVEPLSVGTIDKQTYFAAVQRDGGH